MCFSNANCHFFCFVSGKCFWKRMMQDIGNVGFSVLLCFHELKRLSNFRFTSVPFYLCLYLELLEEVRIISKVFNIINPMLYTLKV